MTSDLKILGSGRIIAVCRSDKKGTRKKAVVRGLLRPDWGMEGDAHVGVGRRQVSLLAAESVKKQEQLLAARAPLLPFPSLPPGAFGENLLTEGIDLARLAIGTVLLIGGEAVLEVTQIGKECHSACEIGRLSGECIMPREGIFARVVAGGGVAAGDPVLIGKSPGG